MTEWFKQCKGQFLGPNKLFFKIALGPFYKFEFLNPRKLINTLILCKLK